MLPITLDELKAHDIACAAAEQTGGIVAPPDYWHIHELGGYAIWADAYVGQVPRTWLTAVPPWVHFKNVCYQVRAADALGSREARAGQEETAARQERPAAPRTMNGPRSTAPSPPSAI